MAALGLLKVKGLIVDNDFGQAIENNAGKISNFTD